FFFVSSVTAVSWQSTSFGGSVTVEETSTTPLWVSSSFGGSVTVTEPETVYVSRSFGGSVTVEGYREGDWSDYWVMTYASAPNITSPNPSNNSDGNPLDLTWSCDISNDDGNNFTWSIECNNSQSNSSTDDVNGTKNLTLTSLTPDTQYTIWVNVTSSTGIQTQNYFYFNVTAGIVLSGENPGDNSIASIDTTQVNVTMEEYNGEEFNWTISGPNITTNSGTYDTNGSKTALISKSLLYNEQIIWNVSSISDNGTALWVNRTYTFSTPTNNTPQHSNLIPGNGATGVPLDQGTISFDLNDAEGDLMNWSVTTSPSIGSDSETYKTNGTYSIPISSLAYDTTYQWTLKTEDDAKSDEWNNQTYSFTTVTSSQNPPDTPTSPSPSDGATGQSVDLTISCAVSDPDGDSLNTTFYWTNDTIIGYDDTTPSGGRADTSVTNLNFNTTYTWYAIVNDSSYSTQSPQWSFTTDKATTILNTTPSKYSFGHMDIDESKSSSEIVLENDGSSDINSIELKASNLNDIHYFNTWVLANSPGLDEYSLEYYTDDWYKITDSYSDIGETILSQNSKAIKFRLHTPVATTIKKKMFGDIYIRYTGSVERVKGFSINVSTAEVSNINASNYMNLSEKHLIKPGTLSGHSLYLSLVDNLTTNTTINVPSKYETTTFFFFSTTKTIDSYKVYGINYQWQFEPVEVDKNSTSFKFKNIDDSYYGYVVVPNPGFFESETWYNLLNSGKTAFKEGESLSW
ncbi:MAG: hypothetical protein V5A63_18905, partial [Bacteroides sp.]|uniref:hypothetical protein n=1 Tax=Bacteroides sp. TaxID=29523 RepID=UPI002FC3CAD9